MENNCFYIFDLVEFERIWRKESYCVNVMLSHSGTHDHFKLAPPLN